MERVELRLEELTFSQKLDIMEAIWEDLSHDQTSFESPGWHEAILKERELSLVAGTATISNWNDAKSRIRKNTQ